MIFYLLTIINLLTFFVFFADKRKAIKHQRRISENTLLMLSFFGGSVGAAIGMLIFRHKISKITFLIKFFGVIVLQTILLIIFYQKLKQLYI
ncbi:DUF1294 domain-containing protein [Chryseobacterium sp. Ch-15]|uniref:DUF1294 domain-containing protein n=1 Tax=Chryseobacterium muglaense TaxID=2893752 RepID=A0A9Q3UQI1_9FLAO|nr:DUF1294 domain-containing protein [Chryseobacterium muglaense]MBD3904797.1 DUF1294 domain-containing protein [Chryseobacterium muglaense]MCC9033643.1 DUF1294 domain-containing protein [Chryseobacterium muglaense]MCM2554718.1 DUF1294 domain-containing protein [Chryseobacterium muglaense]